MQVEIVGGRSVSGRISILSDDFVSTATYKKGKITNVVKARPPMSGIINKITSLPIPRLVRVTLFMLDSLTIIEWLCLGLFLISIFVGKFLFSTNLLTMPIHIHLNKSWDYIGHLMILFGTYAFIRDVAPWHGAEHMTIAAYKETNSTRLEDIEKQSPINIKCGGRLFLPFLTGMFISYLIAKHLGLNPHVITLIVIEGLLWVDHLWGWQNIPVTSQASYILQKFVTTSKPDIEELMTAQCAIENLVLAHERNQS